MLSSILVAVIAILAFTFCLATALCVREAFVGRLSVEELILGTFMNLGVYTLPALIVGRFLC